MARTNDDALKAKQRKQKIILAVGGVLLVGLLAIQLPKLMGGSSESAPEPAPAETTAATPDPGTGATAGSSSPAASQTAAAPAGKPTSTALLVGVSVPGGFEVEAGDGQLEWFGRFPTKDPFVQQVDDKQATGAEASSEPKAEPAADQPKPGDDAVPSVVSGDGTGGSQPGPQPAQPGTPAKPAKPAPPTYATIVVNKVDSPVQVKTVFPQGEPLFVVRELAKRSATIGIAGGGTFASGKATLKLERNRPVTLVNQATGTRYTIELVYLGSQPEQTASFTQEPGDGSQAATPAAGG